MKWSEQAWAAALPVYNRIIEMPFIEELAAGTLPQEKFLYYIAQDDLYLHDYAKAMALVAAKNDTPEGTAEWLNFAQIALYSEREMHETFFKNTPAPKAAEMGPACHHYTSFLKSTAALEPAAVGMAAVLPCFWVYKEVGAHIHRMMADVCEIAGSDRDGIYLIVKDDTLPDFPISRGDDASAILLPKKTSLVHYHLVTGVLQPMISNVQAACVAGENHDVLFYASAEPEENRFGRRFVIKRRQLPYSADGQLFLDEFLNSIEHTSESEAAHRVTFSIINNAVLASLDYPYPSDYPYNRYIVFGLSGEMLVDSEQEDFWNEWYDRVPLSFRDSMGHETISIGNGDLSNRPYIPLKNTKLITSFFNIVSLLFNALLPSLHKLLYALRKKKCFWLSSEPRMHRFLHA